MFTFYTFVIPEEFDFAGDDVIVCPLFEFEPLLYDLFVNELRTDFHLSEEGFILAIVDNDL